MNRLEARLAELAALGQTISYGDLARELAIPGPGAIAKLTAALEALMEIDTSQGRPLRAALCMGRLAGGLPAQGFFDKAAALGRYDGSDPALWVAAERARLFSIPPAG
jgi:HAMP domain-containing protein